MRTTKNQAAKKRGSGDKEGEDREALIEKNRKSREKKGQEEEESEMWGQKQLLCVCNNIKQPSHVFMCVCVHQFVYKPAEWRV